MLFTLEIENPLDLRLQLDGSWRIISEDRAIMDFDFATEDIEEIKSKSQKGLCFEFEGKTISIGSDKNVVMHENYLNLSFTSSIFRKLFPNNPNYNQMIQAISCGNDSYNNTLILNIFGDFELRRDLNGGIVGNDPSIVARHDPFLAGNGYVGLKALQGRRDWLEDLYRTSLKYWKDHFVSHRTQEHVNHIVDDRLEDIRRDLEKIKETWLPEY